MERKRNWNKIQLATSFNTKKQSFPKSFQKHSLINHTIYRKHYLNRKTETQQKNLATNIWKKQISSNNFHHCTIKKRTQISSKPTKNNPRSNGTQHAKSNQINTTFCQKLTPFWMWRWSNAARALSGPAAAKRWAATRASQRTRFDALSRRTTTRRLNLFALWNSFRWGLLYFFSLLWCFVMSVESIFVLESWRFWVFSCWFVFCISWSC